MKIAQTAALVALFAIGTQYSFAAYDVLDCSSDPVFGQNSCTQCFRGDAVSAGDDVGFLTDDFLNDGSVSKIVYKEEQNMPEMTSLAPSDVSVSQNPTSDNFWEYTDAFNALYSTDEEGYVIPAGQKVTWIQSKLGYSYKVDTNTLPAGNNALLLAYTLSTHDINTGGDIALESQEHKECVLYASAGTPETPVTPTSEPPKELPKTGPEHIILALVALLLGFGILKMRKKA